VDYGWLLFGPAMLTWGLIGARPKDVREAEGTERSLTGADPQDASWKTFPLRFGGWVAGAAVLLTLLGLPPAYAELKGMEADSDRQAKKFSAAKDGYADAARIDRTSAEWPRMAGRVLMYDLRDPQGAVPFFEEAVRRDPLRGNVRHSLAVAYAATGQAERALQTFSEALSLEPNGVRILMDAANLHESVSERELLAGNNASALDHKRRALDLYRKVTQVESSPVNRVKALAEMQDPGYVFAHQRLAEDALRRGDRAEAAREIAAGIRSADEYLKGLERWREVMKVEGRFNPQEEAAVRAARAEMVEWNGKLQALK
jgi:tetratricopeptide (TPR) repeat protein